MRKFCLLLLIALASTPGDAHDSVTESATIEGREYRLGTYLWRDFMPISPPDGQPLIASVQLQGEGKSPQVNWLHLKVLQAGKTVWDTKLENQDERGMARGGPKLKIDSTVTVLATFRDASGKEWKLRAENQKVHATH